MKSKKHTSITLKYILFVTFLFISTAILTGLISGVLIMSGIFNPFIQGRSPFPVLLGFIGSNAIMGIILAFAMGRRTVRISNTILDGIDQIGKGNFDIQIKKDEQTPLFMIEVVDSINLMAKQLASLEIMKTGFINDFSHDFKTPMSAIIGYSERLKSAKLTPEQQKEYIDIIIEESRRLLNMANNTLQISKLENTHEDIKLEPYRLDEQIRTSIILLEYLWTNKKVHINVSLEKVTFNGNRDLMRQVWDNLLENAIKFSKPKSSVSVTLVSKGDDIIVTISDNGVGISEENLPRIFDKFYQVGESRSEKGSGLGLSIVKRIVELHDGEINVSSTLGSGTTFEITLPNEFI